MEKSNLYILYLSGIINENQYYEELDNQPQNNNQPQQVNNQPQANKQVQHNSLQYIQQVANEFYQYVGGKFQGCPLGHGGSGNCSWFAKTFYEWAKNNKKGNLQILFFIWSEKEDSAHIVPVLNGYIIDYIQEFSQNTPFKISPVGNPKNNQILPIKDLPGDVSSYYEKWYNEFILGDTISHINSIMTNYMKQKYGSNEKSFEVGPFEQPKSQS
jgi:hypothetical protein